jgi:hypothetical protein
MDIEHDSTNNHLTGVGGMNREDLIKNLTARQPFSVKVSFGEVLVKPLTRVQLDHMVELAAKFDKDRSATRNGALRWFALSNSVVDENGSLVFQKEDRDLFDQMDSRDTEAIFEAVLSNSTTSKEDKAFLS